MSKVKILIADDGMVIRTVVSRKLEEAGYDVVAVSDGKEVLEIVGTDNFQLLVLDIYMPELDGVETLKHLRKTYSAIQLPIIMATAKDKEADVVGCFDDGANDFVSKPINFPILLARIATQLKLKNAIEQLESREGQIV